MWEEEYASQEGTPGIRLTMETSETDDPLYNNPQQFNFHEEAIHLGRAPGNDVTIPSAAASGKHARIFRQGTEFFLEDLGSRNGTYLNERRLQANEKKLLRDGDSIRIIHYRFNFSIGLAAYQPEQGESTTQIALAMIQGVLGGSFGPEDSPPQLIVMTGPQQGQCVELSEIYSEITLGRAPSCSLTLQDENISREHCLIRRDHTGVSIRDLNSRNGILLNGERVERNVEHKLNDRDEITVGTIVLSFSDPIGAEISDKVNEVGDHPEVLESPSNGGSRGVPPPSTPPPDASAGGPPPPDSEPPPPDGMEPAPAPDEEGASPEGQKNGEGASSESEEDEEGEENTPPPVEVKTKLTALQILLIAGISILLLVLVSVVIVLMM